MKFYKGEYLIGIYAPVEEGETLLGLCDNITDFAKLLGITYKDSSQILRMLFNQKTKGLKFCGKICSVEFIKC